MLNHKETVKPPLKSSHNKTLSVWERQSTVRALRKKQVIEILLHLNYACATKGKF